MELVADPSPLRPTEPKTDPTAGAAYVPKEQRIFESLKVPGYETPEKSNVSYKKLKEKENNISYNSTTGKIFKDDPNVRIPQKDLVNQLQKENIADEWSGPSHRGPSYDHSARTLQQEQELGKKMWLAKQKEENKSPLPVWMGDKYKSDLRSSNQKKRDAWAEKKKDAYDEKKFGIKQRLKNVRGPSTAELIYKGMSPQEKGSHNAEYRRKNLDNPLGPGSVVGKPFPKDTFTLPPDHGPRTNKGIIKAFVQTPRKETNGLSEEFVIQKLREKSIF